MRNSAAILRVEILATCVALSRATAAAATAIRAFVKSAMSDETPDPVTDLRIEYAKLLTTSEIWWHISYRAR